MKKHRIPVLSSFVILLFLFLSGCGWMVSSAVKDISKQLVDAVMNENDLKTVEDGAPAYLIMMDGFLRSQPDDVELLVTTADMYSAYAEVFVREKDRSKRLTEKAFSYSMKAVQKNTGMDASLSDMPFESFRKRIDGMKKKDVPVFFPLGAAWAGYIQARRDDMDAIAQLPRVSAIMKRIAELDEGYRDGSVHVYLGVLETLIPPALGGKPEKGKAHFARALELSGGKNLMAKVLIAERYARLVFDRDLHDRLLKEVVDADPNVPGYVLMNTLARKRAGQLLLTADEYF